jgi:hypothetical protein
MIHDPARREIEESIQRVREGSYRPPAEHALMRWRNDAARSERQWYEWHRDAFIETGDEEELRQMLEHVT